MVEGGEAGRESGEGFVDVGASLVTDGQAPEAVEPGVGSLDDPAVPPELLAAVDPAPSDAGYDPPGAALLATGAGVVGLVGMKLVGTAAWATAPAVSHGRDRIEGRGHHYAFVAVGPVKVKPRGVPRASTTRWRLVPGLPRSVGFGPVAEPPFSPVQTRCSSWPGSS